MLPEWNHSNNDGSQSEALAGREAVVKRFSRCLQHLVGPARYQKWFADRTSVAINGEVVTIGLASPFMIKWMAKEFSAVATEAARECLGLSAHVRFDVDSRAVAMQSDTLVEKTTAGSSKTASQSEPVTLKFTPALSAPQAGASADSQSETASQQTGDRVAVTVRSHEKNSVQEPTSDKQKLLLRRRRFARLEDFVVGGSNEVACSMARMVAESPGEKYNPLYIYGSVGVGKTHLLEGIHTEARLRFPEMTVMYLTAEAFANYYTKALREKTLPAFRRRFRSVDVLLVDDIEFLDAKKGIQEEFCHTIQELLTYNRQVVLAADRHPRMLTNIRQDLSTRFMAGLVTRLETPDAATRLEIVRQQVQKLNLPASEEALEHLSRKFSRNVRELLGAVNCLRTYHELTRKPVGITAARDVLKNLEQDCLRIIRASDIQNAVCELFGVPQQDLISNKRTRQLTQPRMLAMYLTRQWTQSAYQEIGQQFGGRNHSTVISAERKMKGMLKQNARLQISSREWTAQEVVAMLAEQLQVG